MFHKSLTIFIFTCFCFFDFSYGSQVVYLRDNLQKAKVGDYIVTLQSKTYTLLHIFQRSDTTLTIEEITVPSQRIPQKNFSWKTWVQNGAPGHTCWVMYPVNLATGSMDRYFSVSKNQWFKLIDSENFLSTLLNLRFTKIPAEDRKRVGPPPLDGSPDRRKLWQPRMIVEGRQIEGITFEAMYTQWPKDGGPLSGKSIEVFVPEDHQAYPAYFPYWLQIRGMVGKAHVYIMDSGTAMTSPAKI